MSELKPCPFCGGNAMIHRDDANIKIACSACLNQTGYGKALGMVAERWNTRTSPKLTLLDIVNHLLENGDDRFSLADAVAGVEGKYPDTWENKEVGWDQILVESLNELKVNGTIAD
jgi:Lar family restriction alleviation protein